MSQELFIKALVACCLEIVIYSYSSQRYVLSNCASILTVTLSVIYVIIHQFGEMSLRACFSKEYFEIKQHFSSVCFSSVSFNVLLRDQLPTIVKMN